MYHKCFLFPDCEFELDLCTGVGNSSLRVLFTFLVILLIDGRAATCDGGGGGGYEFIQQTSFSLEMVK